MKDKPMTPREQIIALATEQGLNVKHLGPTDGFYAVQFFDESGNPTALRFTSKRVSNPLQALDDVLGSRYSVPQPMVIDILHDFSNVVVKCIARNLTELRLVGRRRQQLADPAGWVHPSYPPALVARAKAIADEAGRQARLRGEGPLRPGDRA